MGDSVIGGCGGGGAYETNGDGETGWVVEREVTEGRERERDRDRDRETEIGRQADKEVKEGKRETDRDRRR